MNPVSYLRARPGLNLMAVMFWMALIYIGSATPQEEIPGVIGPIAKMLHMFEYAALGFLILPYVSLTRRPLAYAVACATWYALTDELHQLYVPGRHGSPYDILIDCAGSTMGAYLAKRWGP